MIMLKITGLSLRPMEWGPCWERWWRDNCGIGLEAMSMLFIPWGGWRLLALF